MNRIYRSIWNEVSRTFVATAEIVRSRGKSASRSQGLDASLATLEAGERLGAGGHPAHAPPMARLRSMLRPLALEQRFMFDGAAAATVDAHVNDVPVTDAAAIANAFAAHAEQSAPARDAGREASFATEPALVREAAPELNHGRREVVFIDTHVADYQSLLGGIGQGIEVRLIDGAQDGIAQIARWAETHAGYDAIHLFSHGASGSVTLGSVSLTGANLDAYQNELASIGAALTESGDILVYGCRVAAGQPGVDLLGRLAQATGADIAASTDITGAVSLGGDWQLEYATGSVEAPSIDLSRDYAGILGTINMTEAVDAYSGTNGEADIFVLPAEAANGAVLYTAWGGLYNNNGQWHLLNNIIVISNFDVSQDKIDMSALGSVINPSNVPNYAIKVAYGTDFSTFSPYDINFTSAQYNGSTVSNWKGGTTGAWLEFNDDNGNPTLNVFFPGVNETTFTLANFIFPTAGPAAPGAPDLSAASDTGISSTDNITGDTTPTFTGSGASAGATIKLYESSILLGTTTADASGNWTITSSTLGAGAHSITAKQTVDGTESAASSPLSVTIDTSAPTASVTSVAVKPGTSVTAAQSTETGKVYLVSSSATVTDMASLDALVTAGSAKSATVGVANSNTTLATTGLADGTYKVYSVDAGGNVSAASAGTVTIDNTAPTIGSVSAANVNSAGGSTYDFTVTYADAGSGLDTASFDGNDITVTGPNSYSSPATYVSHSGNTATYRITPPGGTWDGADAGTYTIALAASQVRDTAGNYVAASANVGSFDVSFNPAPVVATPPAINLTDTAVADTFSNQSGILSATDADGIVSYGIQSPSSTSAGFLDGGVTYDISKTGTYGTLYLVSTGPDMGKYVYVPNGAAIDMVAGGAAPTDTFTVTATDANGSPSTGTAVLTVNISGTNDAPVLSATGTSPGFTENGAAVPLFGGVSVSSIESGEKLDQLVLTVSNLADGSSEILQVDGTDVALTDGNSVTTASNGLTVGISLSGGLATVTIGKSGGVSAGTLQGVVSGLAYRNTSESPGTADRVVTLTSVRDVGGTANGGVDTASLSITSTITVTSVNDAPTDITVGAGSINQSAAGAGSTVATLGVVDLDAGDTHAFALVSGAGDTDNDLFVVDGGALKIGSTALPAGTYHLRLRVTDSGAGNLAYEKQVTIVVADDVGPIFDAAGSIPADGASGVAPSANLQLSFKENIVLGATGTIELRDLTNNIVVQTWDLSNPAHVGAGNGQVSVSGTTLTLNPTANLAEATHYAIRISAAAVEDSGGNPFTGIADDTTFDFSTGVTDSAAPVLQSILRNTPAGATTNSDTLTFTLRFNEAVIGADTADFQLATSGSANGTISQVTGNGTGTLTVTVSGVSGTGTLGLGLRNTQNITDLGGNALANGDPAADQVFNVDRDLPALVSINRVGNADVVSGSSVQFLVIFSEAVKNVSTADFSLLTTGTAGGQIASVSGTGSAAIVVTVNGLSGAGSVALALAPGFSVDDLADNALVAATPTSGLSESYVVDVDAPVAVSITRLGPALTDAGSLSFQVVFSEPVKGVDIADFVLASTGTATGTISSVTGSAGSYTVNLTGVGGTGTLGLAFAGGQNITDLGGAAFAGAAAPLAETYHLDNSPPGVLSIARAGVDQIAAGTPTDAVFTVVFDEPVSGVSASDFTVTGTAGNGGITHVSSTDGKVFQVTVGSVNGTAGQTLGLDFTGSASDALAHASSASFNAGQHYTIGGLLLNEGALDQAALDALVGVNRDGTVRVVVASGPVTEVVIIDSRVPGMAGQLGQIRAGVDVWLLDARSSATAQISGILSGYSGLSAVHLISHGSSGNVYLGAETLSSSSLGQYAATLAAWGQSLNATGDLLVYGCDVAKGAAGQHFVEALAQATGADVAASNDLTGASWLGGDWDLEVNVGDVDRLSVLQSGYENVLAVHTTINLDVNGNSNGNILYARPNSPTYTWTFGTAWTGNSTGIINSPMATVTLKTASPPGTLEYSSNNGTSWTTAAYNTAISVSGKIWRFTTSAGFSSNTDISLQYTTQDPGLVNPTAFHLVYDSPPTNIAITYASAGMGNRIFDASQPGAAVATLQPTDVGKVTAGYWEIESQSVPGLFAISSNTSSSNSATLSIGNGTVPAAGQTATVTVRYYDHYQTDSSGNPIGGSGYSKIYTFTVIPEATRDLAGFGDDFALNSTTESVQASAVVARLSTGNYVAAWSSTDQGDPGGPSSIVAQIFSSTGQKVGGEIIVSPSNHEFYEAFPAVTALANGRFVVAYSSSKDSDGDFDVRYVIVEANGTVGQEGVANASSSQIEESFAPPAVTTLSDGSFLIAWASYASDYSTVNVLGQRFSAVDGSRIGGEITLSGAALASGPALASIGNGRYAVSWAEYDDSWTLAGVFAKVSDGSPFQIVAGSDMNRGASLAGLAGGGFVAVWEHGTDIYYQRYSSDGTPQGSPALANAQTAGTQGGASVSALSDGGFIISWQSDQGDYSSNGIFGRRFDASGNAVDVSDFQINQHRLNDQSAVSVVGGANGAFMAVWSDDQGDGPNDPGVEGRVYVPSASPVPVIANFADTLNYTVGSVARIIDQGTAATVTDGDSADFDTGVLTVSGVGTGDVIQIRNQGTGAGQIGISGQNVTYGGTVIGTYGGGLVSTLTVTLNANSSAEAVSALLQNLTYRNDVAQSGTVRTLTVTLSDGDGNTSAPVHLSINATTTASSSANLLIKVGTDNPYNNSGTLGGYNAAQDSGAASVVDAVPGGLDGLGTLFNDTDAVFSYGGKLYGLFVNPAETGRGFRFASYDGTEVVYLASEAFEAIGSVTIADGRIFFVANRVGGGPEVYQFDVASSALTHIGGTHNQAGIQFYAGDLFFFTRNYEVARWDGSAVHVVWAAQTSMASFTDVMVVLNSRLYFGASQPVGEGPSNIIHNAEIYVYDAVTGNVTQLTDRNANTNIYTTEMPKHLVVYGEKVFFAGTNSTDPQNAATVNDHNLISVDGAGTLVTEFQTGNDGWIFGTWSIGGSLYFSARLGGDSFTNLYKYNGTGSATNLTGFTSGNYSIADVTAYAGAIYFTVSIPEGGGGLYKYDGSTISAVAGFPALNTSSGVKEKFEPGLVVFDGRLAPVVTNTADLVGIVAGGSTLVSPALAVIDIDSPTLAGATVTVTQGRQAGDSLTFTPASGITGSYNSGTGVLTLSGAATAAQYQAVLRTVTFNASATAGQRDFQFRVTDSEGNQSWGNSPAGRAYIAVAEAGSSVTVVRFDTDPTAGAKVGTVDIADSNLGNLQVIAPLDSAPTPTYGIGYDAGTASLAIVSDWDANPGVVTIKSENGAGFDLQGFRFTDSIDLMGDVSDLLITGFRHGAQTAQTTVRINLYGPQTTVILPTSFDNVDEVRIETGPDSRTAYPGGALGGLLDDIMVLSRPSGPSISSATYDAGTGTLLVTTTGLTAGNAIDETRLTLKGEGGATYTLTETGSITATSETSFTITLNAADRAAVNQIFNKSGTRSTDVTTYNLAAAADWYGTGNADVTGNGVTVSSVPLPAISSATYDAATGVLVVTGSGFTQAAGAANDIDVTKLSLTGTGGLASAFTLTGDTSDVEITSDTEFTITLGSADRAALNAILNVNGSEYSAGNLYNLAAADDWARGADAALNIGDATSGVTVSGVNPAPVLATPPVISLTDTAAADSFGNQSGVLSATDADGVAGYGIQGGTPGSYTIGGDSFQVSKAGTYGTLYVNSGTGAYVFVPDAAAINGVAGGATPSETFTVTATDGHAPPATGTSTLRIEVSGANDAPSEPTLDGGITGSLAQSAASAGATVGALAATDSEGGSLTYTLVTGSGSTDNDRFSIDGSSLKVGGAALEAGTYSVRVRVTDAGTPATASSERILSITITDDVAPTLIGNQSSPADNATEVAPTASLVLKFSEAIVAGSGTISLVNVTTGAVVETFDVATGIGSAGGSLSISGATLTLVPGSDLAQATQYAVQVPAALVKDGGNNPFGGTSGNTSYNFTTGSTDTTAPSVAIVEASGPLPHNAGSVAIRFSEPVRNVDISAFRLTRDGVPVDISGLTLTGSGSEYSLDLGGVTGIDGSYVLTLDPSLAATPITDSSGNALPLGATGSFTVDTTAPSGATIVRASASPTSASSVNFTVVFSEAVSGVDAADFELAGTATSGASIASVTRISDSVYSVAVNGLSGSGTLGLNLKPSGTGIADRAGNALSGGASGQLYTLDAGLPSVLSITRNSQEVTAADSVSFTVSFNKAVSGVDATDFVIDKGAGVIAAAGDISVSGSGSTYTVTVANVAGDGRLGIGLKSTGTGIIDGSSHAIDGGFTGGESYLIDNTIPVIETNQSFNLPENMGQGFVIGQVRVGDANRVTGFSIVNGNAEGYFAIDADGVITLTAAGAAAGAASSDYETGPNSFTLGIIAVDEAGNAAASANVGIHVLDEEENHAPVVAAPLISAAVEGASAYHIDLLQGATDPDAGDMLAVSAVTYTVDGLATANSGQALPGGLSRTGATLSVDPADAAFDDLAAGATRVIVVSYSIDDGHGGTVLQTASITITGTNDAPTVTAGAASAILVEAGGVANGTAGMASSTINLSKGDVDGTADWDTAWLLANGWSTADAGLTYTKAGTYGRATFTLASGQVQYALDDADPHTQALAAGASVTDSFTVRVSDGSATASVAAVFHITGANDAPLPADDSASVVAGAADATGNVLGNDTDPDAGDTRAVSAIRAGVAGIAVPVAGGSTSGNGASVVTGLYGQLLIGADGSYRYVLDNGNAAVKALVAGGATLSDVFTCTVRDGQGASASSILTITIQGAADAPPTVVGEVTAQNARQDTPFSFTVPEGIFNDPEGGTLSYRATLADGSPLPAWLVFDPLTRTFSGTPHNGDVGALQIRLTATDSGGAAVATRFGLTVANVDDAPTGEVSVAGSPQLGAILTAANTLADADGLGEVSYQWQVSDGRGGWTDIPGAVGSTLALDGGLVGQQVRVVASYTDGQGTATSVASAASGTIAPLPPVPQPPPATPPVTLPPVPQFSVVDAPMPVTGGQFTFLSASGESLLGVGSGSGLGGWGGLGSGLGDGMWGGFGGMGADFGVGMGAGFGEVGGRGGLGGAGITAGSAERVFGTGSLVQETTSGSGFHIAVVAEDSVGGDGLSLGRGIDNADVRAGVNTRIGIPMDAFVHTDPAAQVVLSATLANGQALPGWVRFDARAGTFTVAPPPDLEYELVIRVVARDNQGREVTTLFTIRVGKGAPRAMLEGRPGLSEQLRLAGRPQGLSERLMTLARNVQAAQRSGT